GLRVARSYRGGDDRDQCRARLHAVRRARLLQDRGHRARHGGDRRAVAAARPPGACAAGATDHRALGPGATRMNPLLQLWGGYVRVTARWPIIATLVPFVPVV